MATVTADDKPMIRRLKAFRILLNRTVSPEDLASDLIADGVLNKDFLREVAVSYDKAETLFKAIELAFRDSKLDLVHYDWKVLPTQILTLTLVTPRTKREYKYEDV